MVMERGRDRADLRIAPGRQVARRQAVHRRGRQMHLGPAARQSERQAAGQSAQVVVPQPRRSIDQRRLRGHLPSGTAAAGLCHAAGLGYSVVYPCHVAPAEMRQHPIGTGPFRFVEFKPNERITLTRNPDYWKSGRPNLDGIEFTIIRDMSTAHLAFIVGKTDWIATTIPLMKDITSRAPAAICE